MRKVHYLAPDFVNGDIDQTVHNQSTYNPYLGPQCFGKVHFSHFVPAMPFWANVCLLLGKFILGKCPVEQNILGQKSWGKCPWANIFGQVKVVSEPERIDVFLTRSWVQVTDISCGVVYEATLASLVLFRSYCYVIFGAIVTQP